MNGLKMRHGRFLYWFYKSDFYGITPRVYRAAHRKPGWNAARGWLVVDPGKLPRAVKAEYMLWRMSGGEGDGDSVGG